MANHNPSPETRIRSGNDAETKGRKGGKNSGKTRRQLKTFKEALGDGLTKEEQRIMLNALKRNAERGNLPAFEFLLKMLGEHPDQGNSTESNITIVIDGAGDYGD